VTEACTKSAQAAARAKGVKLDNPNIDVAQGAAEAAVKAETPRAAPLARGAAARHALCLPGPIPLTLEEARRRLKVRIEHLSRGILCESNL
jgi:hypothetical protein